MSEMIGRTLGGYRIEAEIGRGGQAVVYRATQLALQRSVALKVVSSHLSSDPAFMERFKREGIAAANLDHPHVIPVHEAGQVDGMAFLAMKFIDGPSLDAVIRSGNGMDVERAMRVLRQTAQALDYAHHSGLIHRDVKPANILLGRHDHAYLSDFGLTRAMDASRLTSSGVWMGTLEYVAPEQIRGADVTTASDRYALAIVAYEALTGTTIFDQTERTALLYAHMHEPPVLPSTRRGELGAGVDAVFARALSKNPEERPETSVALIDEIAHACRNAGAHGAPGAAETQITPRVARIPPPPPSPRSGTPTPPPVPTPRPITSASSSPPVKGPDRRTILIGIALLAVIAIIVGGVIIGANTGGSVRTNTTTVFVP